MSQEIIYTSVPEGLKPGTRGFCTVVATEGMAKNMLERLESLSAYRHAFTPPDPRAAQNPVNYSHVIVKVAGQKYHVLSRIGDAGLDYSGRTNKLAHHVALEPWELPPGGPAWVVADKNLCAEQWDGKIENRTTRPTPRNSPSPVARCDEWGRVARDPGWAGVLAESVLDGRGRTALVIFPLGTPTLPLIREALSLLPPEKRWEVTFNSYYTTLPAGVDCQWRFLLDGTAEARAARNNAQALVIDLCGPLGAASGGPLVEFARTGRRPEAVPTAGAESPGTYSRRAPPQPAAHVPEADESEYRMVERGRPPVPGAAGLALPPPPRPAPFARASQSKPSLLRRAVPWVGVGALALGGMAVAYFLGTRTGQVSPSLIASKLPDPPTLTTTPQPDPRPKSEAPKPVLPKKPPSAAKKEPPPPPPPDSKIVPESVNPEPKPKEKPKPPPVPEEKKPLYHVRQKQGGLALPPLDLANPIALGRPQELVKIQVASPKNCDLSLHFDKTALAKLPNFEIKTQDSADGSRAWIVSTPGTELSSKPVPVGKFILKNQSLTFQWDRKVKEWQNPESLGYSMLHIQADGESERRLLLALREHPPQVYDWEAEHVYELLGDATMLKPESLRLDVRLEGFPEHKADKLVGLKEGDQARVVFLQPGAKNQTPLAGFTLRLRTEGRKGAAMVVTPFAYLPSGDGKQEFMNRTKLGSIREKYTAREEERLQADRKKLEREIPQEKNELGNLDAQIQQAEADLSQACRAHEDAQKAHKFYKSVQSDKVRQETKLAVQRAESAPPVLKSRRQALAQKIADMEQRLGKSREELEDWKAARRHYDAMWKLLEETKKNGRIHYRLWMEIAGQRPALVCTKGFAPAEPEQGK